MEWINTKDKLPVEGVNVLICDLASNYMTIASLAQTDGYCWFWNGSTSFIQTLDRETYWMPLPDPPE